MKQEVFWEQPHIIRPLLPVAWHTHTRKCLQDMTTIAAIFKIDVFVVVGERRNGDLKFVGVMPGDTDNEPHALMSSVCHAAQDVIPFLCIQCGIIKNCRARMINESERWLCDQHISNPEISVFMDFMNPPKSPWHNTKANAQKLIETFWPAEKAITGLARRYNSSYANEMIARAQSNRARAEIDLITKPKVQK